MSPNPLSPEDVAPLFGTALRGPPHIFDFSSENPRVLAYDPADFARFQAAILQELAASGKRWGIGKYGEERRMLLRRFPGILDEGRMFHAGVDVTGPPGLPLYAPLDGTVTATGKEEGIGNYGGFVILRHELPDRTFLTLYGHLRVPHLVQAGRKIGSGERFAVLGDGKDSGGWFTHTHLQILTEEAIRCGRAMHGYVSAADLPRIDALFPSPYPLLNTGFPLPEDALRWTTAHPTGIRRRPGTGDSKRLSIRESGRYAR